VRVQRPPPRGERRTEPHGHDEREDIGADDGEAKPSGVGQVRVWVHGADSIGRVA
jgi:hypothetical protein